MKIKEIEKLTGLSRANIRFYEKEGLLSPRRTENHYRDYDQEDLRRLRTILVLRKLDLPLEDVRQVLVGELSPSEAARQQSLRLQTQLQETKSARELCRMLELKNDSISSFQPEAYLEEMERRERRGEQFRSLVNDVLDLTSPGLKHWTLGDPREQLRRMGPWRLLGVLLAISLVRGVGKVLFWKESFWDGFFDPWIVCGIALVFGLGFTLLRRRSEKAAKVVGTMFVILALLFFAAIAGFFIYAVIRHFLYQSS